MCIWQAVLAKDVFPESGVKRATLMSVVEDFATLNGITYTERRFNEVFSHQKVRTTTKQQTAVCHVPTAVDLAKVMCCTFDNYDIFNHFTSRRSRK